MERFLCINLSEEAQRIIAALRSQYAPRPDRTTNKDFSTELRFAGFLPSQETSTKDCREELCMWKSSNPEKLQRSREVPYSMTLNQTRDSVDQSILFSCKEKPKPKVSVMMDPPAQAQTFSTNDCIQPASNYKLVGFDEPPPVKKFIFGSSHIGGHHPEFVDESKCVLDIADKQSTNGQTDIFPSFRSNLEDVYSVNKCFAEGKRFETSCEAISENTRVEQAVFLPITSRNLMFNGDHTKIGYEDLKSNFQDDRIAAFSDSVQSCWSPNGGGGIVKCKQDTSPITEQIKDKEDDSMSERIVYTQSRNSPELPVLIPVQPTAYQNFSEAGVLISCSKLSGKSEHSVLSKKASKITLSQQHYKKTLRTVKFPAHGFPKINVKGPMKLDNRKKTLHLEVKRPQRPRRKPLSRQCNKPKALKPQEPTESEPKTIRQMSSDMPTTSSFGLSVTSDPRVCDTVRLTLEEKLCVLEEVKNSDAIVVTMVYQDGTLQLDPEQKPCPLVSGLLVLPKKSIISGGAEARPPERVLYFPLDQKPTWVKKLTQNDDFTREVLTLIMCGSKPLVCFKAKDLLRTALRHFGDMSWKEVMRCEVMDPQIAAWLLDPADSASCFQTLLSKHCSCAATHTSSQHALHQVKTNQISRVFLLHDLLKELHKKLQTQGLWKLYSGVEQKMIPVLAAMESYQIHVDIEALKNISKILASKLKKLEQQAHQAAGQRFLVSSSAQLRLILFEKLRLHERCENKNLPKTIKQQRSTSESALLQLQSLHALPKIILEYRQVHKIKSAFVDGILSCTSKRFVSSTWNQTSTVSGRLSSKHPNLQAIPKQPLMIQKQQYVLGKDSEVVSVHPRAMFVPRDGWTFLSADFCQVELRLLAHLSADPQLLQICRTPESDAFMMLASQWKGVSEDRVSLEDRERAKRIFYSVVYGAGKERLSGILGVSAEEASHFQDSFLKTYGEVPTFIQHIVQQCHKQGFVKSIMGRRRTLPQIHSADWGLRNQAERQAVNFVLQGSAADLTKMAMIEISSQILSTSHNARLVAQIHDELLFEVETSDISSFAALVKKTMESLHYIKALGVNLSVPLKVSLCTGHSWGSMREINPG